MTLLMRRLTALTLALALLCPAALAEVTMPQVDVSPAIYVYQKNAASVVGIITIQERWSATRERTVQSEVAQGSGVVYAEGGYVVTNNHVIEDGNAWQILLPDGNRTDAALVGTDESTDLAVLRVVGDSAAQLQPVDTGASADLLIGSAVIAIGNPGGEVLSNTVTQGIVSALDRSAVRGNNATLSINYIQHDAAINSGNSGGGLFNFQGYLVGINTLKYAGSAYTSTRYEGLGFAIPVEVVTSVADELIAHGKVRRAETGIIYYEHAWGPSEPTERHAPYGVYVAGVIEGGPADGAGFLEHDHIYAIDGERVHAVTDIMDMLNTHTPGDSVTVQVVRYAQIALGEKASALTESGVRPSFQVSGGFEYVDISVTLAILDTAA